MYDTYTRYIFEWLQGSNLDSVAEILEQLKTISIALYCLLLLWFFVWLGFKILKIGGR